jgi:hypothetical protein
MITAERHDVIAQFRGESEFAGQGLSGPLFHGILLRMSLIAFREIGKVADPEVKFA